MPHLLTTTPTLSFCIYCRNQLKTADSIKQPYHSDCQTEINNYTPPKLSLEALFIQTYPDYHLYGFGILLEPDNHFGFMSANCPILNNFRLEPATIQLYTKQENIITLNEDGYYLNSLNEILKLASYTTIRQHENTLSFDPAIKHVIFVMKDITNDMDTLAFISWKSDYLFIPTAPIFPSEIVSSN